MPNVVSQAPGRWRAVGRIALLASVLLAVWLLARRLGVLALVEPERLGEAIRHARELPWAAPAFVLVYALVASLGLPGTPLTLAGGAIFGVAAGTGLNWLGATIGAIGAFVVARALGGDALRSLLGKRAAALDTIAGDGAFASLVRLRLIPVVPFNALNFGAGLAGVRPGAYIGSTALGIIPGTAVYTYFAGSLLAGVDGARQAAFTQVAIAGALLVALSFVPTLARRMGWIAAPILLVVSAAVPASPLDGQSSALAVARAPVTVDHSAFDALLKQHVTGGLVDYEAISRDARFAAYLRVLDRTDPSALDATERLAYWINTYNAFTIELINSRGEHGSIRNINKWFGIPLKSPWAEPIVRAGGRVLTLDDVEHRIIRVQFHDPRVHAALVCAAMGCPPLRSEAFVGARLDEQLDDQVTRFLAQRAKNRVDVGTGVVHGSPIFTWYRDDFGGTLAGVGAFWAKYLPAGPEHDLLASGRFTWVDTDYDWSLNGRR